MQRSEILEKFHVHSILPTPQRLEVAGILLEKPQHLSADQIIDRLRGAGSSVSKATVYNTLNLFSERGLVKELTVDPERTYYDSSTRPHHHFYNLDSGALTDIDAAGVEVLNLPELPEGTRAESVEILVSIRNS